MTFRMPLFALIFAVTSQVWAGERFTDPSAEQKVDQIVSVFENSTPEIQYSYIEALNDGRGYTAGRAGFTTATGDLVLVVERYREKSPTVTDWPALQLLLPQLHALAKSGSGATQGIESLVPLWQSVSDDSKFRDAQDEVSDELYKKPAREYCQKLGLKTALGFLVIYDAIIQHGNGSDEDSIGAMIQRTHSNGEETSFVRAFLDVRRADLMNPSNTETTREWRESVDRVDALKRLVDSGNWNLASPLRLEVWGDTYAF